MIKTGALLSPTETVGLLTKEFGELVVWGPFLADIRRSERPGKAPPTLYGHQLHPYAIWERRTPMYHPADINKFVQLVRFEMPGFKRKEAGSDRYKYDSTPGVHWKMRKVELVA